MDGFILMYVRNNMAIPVILSDEQHIALKNVIAYLIGEEIVLMNDSQGVSYSQYLN